MTKCPYCQSIEVDTDYWIDAVGKEHFYTKCFNCFASGPESFKETEAILKWEIVAQKMARTAETTYLNPTINKQNEPPR